MEDGTVSIFGLVAGVSLTASSGRSVLVAGAAGEIASLMGRLRRTGLQSATLEAIDADLRQRPAGLPELERNAAFAVLPLEQARVVSLLMTLVLLVPLGYGRARIGERKVLPWPVWR
jgi:VIT1/CCC1 family predicted Fe2+/Mn2+ transporter